MENRPCRAAGLLLVMALLAGALPAAADDAPIRLRATAAFGPLGFVQSAGAALVNGRAVREPQTIWGGESVEAVRSGARLMLEDFGRVSLRQSAVARVSRGEAAAGDVLLVSLVRGDIEVRLRDDARALVEAAGQFFSASGGAAFLLSAREGQVVMHRLAGEVRAEQQPQRRYILRPVGLGSGTSVRARATRQIQVQVTDENDNPVPDLPVVFLVARGDSLVSAAGAPASNVTVTTNARGLASVNFNAGGTVGPNEITASVPGTQSSLTITVNVLPPAGGFFSLKTIGIIGAAAGVATGIAISEANEQAAPPITAEPPIIRPR